MPKINRDDVIAAPVVGAVVGVLAFFMLYSLAGFKAMGGELGGLPLGLFISLVMAAVAGAAVMGELLARALEGK